MRLVCHEKLCFVYYFCYCLDYYYHYYYSTTTTMLYSCGRCDLKRKKNTKQQVLVLSRPSPIFFFAKLKLKLRHAVKTVPQDLRATGRSVYCIGIQEYHHYCVFPYVPVGADYLSTPRTGSDRHTVPYCCIDIDTPA